MEIGYKQIIHLILVAESLLFSIQLLTYRNISSKSSRILGLLMLFMFTYFSVTALWYFSLYDIAIYGQYLMMPLFLSLNPFYYLYVKSLTTPGFKFKKKNLLNFLPASIVLLLGSIFYSLLDSQEKLLLVATGTKLFNQAHTLFKINVIINLLAVGAYYIQLIVYVILMINLLQKHKHNINNYFSYEQNISLTWLKTFIVIIVANSILEVFIAFSFFTSIYHVLEAVYYGMILFLINFIGYFGIKQSDIYVGRLLSVDNKNINQPLENNKEVVIPINQATENNVDIVEQDENQLHHPPISEEEQKKIVAQVKELMETKKLYLNSKLSIYDIAHLLNINKTYISLSINNILNMNFRHFVNEYRIAEAQKMLGDPKYEHLSIEGIAQNVGYVSKSTFNNSFQKITGKKPSDFRKEQLFKNQ